MLHDAHRRRGARADHYLCWLCQQSPAAAWDHCHEHRYFRGPLCGSCNTREGTGMPYLSSASKVRRCISWHAADASINGPCRAGSTPPSSARTWKTEGHGRRPHKLRPRGGTRPRVAPIRAGVQRMARQLADEGRDGARDGRARAAGLRRRDPRRTGRWTFSRLGRGVTGVRRRR
ncbi:endonuclease domain-containing protein [Streptomyces sp. NPDC020571]|uniref:endonuclease domain-containing protein n=1 Tax=unclassified Streptomyces TaxID=2593676 RepID=UPI0037BDBB39